MAVYINIGMPKYRKKPEVSSIIDYMLEFADENNIALFFNFGNYLHLKTIYITGRNENKDYIPIFGMLGSLNFTYNSERNMYELIQILELKNRTDFEQMFFELAQIVLEFLKNISKDIDKVDGLIRFNSKASKINQKIFDLDL